MEAAIALFLVGFVGILIILGIVAGIRALANIFSHEQYYPPPNIQRGYSVKPNIKPRIQPNVNFHGNNFNNQQWQNSNIGDDVPINPNQRR